MALPAQERHLQELNAEIHVKRDTIHQISGASGEVRSLSVCALVRSTCCFDRKYYRYTCNSKACCID